MSAIDDYLLKSEPLHAVDCALWIPTTMCSCGGDKLAEVARAELAALRQKLAMVESQANLGYATIAEYEAEIGDPPEGSHPDERKPRAATWHCERLNWIAELAALREENAKLRADLLEARRITTTLDCRYTLGDVADISGNHCPPDKPCERCNNEREIARLRALVSDVAIGLNAARKSAESIGDGISRTWDVSLLLAAAERCDDFWRTA